MSATVRIGHWTRDDGRSGCTVLLFDALTPAVVDVRGGAPGSRETDLLRSGSLVGSVDAILLTGGSAFGLSAADGVMRYLREQGRGVPTSGGPVPIVSAAVIFDLDGELRPPDASAGYAASETATMLTSDFATRDGVGAGATFQKMWGPAFVRRAGVAAATVTSNAGKVTAVVALNAIGAPLDSPLKREALLHLPSASTEREATTIGALIVDGVADRDLLTRCAIAAHDGLARSIAPSHTLHDGDLFFAAGPAPGTPDQVARLQLPLAAELAVERAIQSILQLPQP
ncbi:MAG: P1 family peptidase [Thermomicrobiales bacterium]|nr:P1 family peptidase [Thermomicrobiales bacterium]